MQRKVSLIVSVTCLLCLLAANGSRAEMRGVLGAGVGTVSGIGGPIGDGNTSAQLFTLHGFGLFGLNSWGAVIGDITFGLPRTYNGSVAGGESQKVELSSFYFDALAGVYQIYSEGGYMYLAAGFAIATANREDTIADPGVEVFDSDAGATFGFSFGAGFGLPIRNSISPIPWSGTAGKGSCASGSAARRSGSTRGSSSPRPKGRLRRLRWSWTASP